jgi:hypothetical protein
VEVRFKEGDEAKSWTLGQTAKGWHLTKPEVDRLDPDKRSALLQAVADLWAERFVEARPGDVTLAVGGAALPGGGLPAVGTSAAWASAASSSEALLERTGLAKPDRTISVTEGGKTVTLQIGAVSAVRPDTTGSVRFARRPQGRGTAREGQSRPGARRQGSLAGGGAR